MGSYGNGRARVTSRTKAADLITEDKTYMRWVVYRQAGKVARRTSVHWRGRADDRGPSALARRRAEARRKAERIAERLKNCPASRLAEFRFR
jgi:hypothetical protein